MKKKKKLLLSLFCFVIIAGFAMPIPLPAVAAATIYVPDNYPTIQAAVNAATSGDAIIVRNGIYTENVYVDKSLTIQSDNGADYTIVRGANSQNHVFHIAANNVNISGFTVQSATGSGICGMSCDYPGCYSGIYLDSVTGCSISNNRIFNNYFGVYLSNCQDSDITDNDILFNSRGINVHSSSRNRIAKNRIYYSGWVMYRSDGGTSSINGSGISFFSSSSENEIVNNVFSRNDQHDISSSSNSRDNIFYQNSFVDDKNYNISFDQGTTGVLNSTKEIAYTYNGNTYTSYLGNYYMDYHTNYDGSDADGDGIGDRPYDINWNNPYKDPHYDNYPLIGPFEDTEIGSTPASRPPVRTDYTLTIQVNGSGFAIPEIGAHDYREGGRVETTATPDSDWEFDSWSGDVADSGSVTTCVLMFTDKTIAANFFESSPISTPPPSGLADSAWPMFRHDPQRTGRSSYTGPETSSLKWSFATAASVTSSPVIDPDGTVYIGSLDGNLYAINPDGSIKWSYNMGRMVESTPAIGLDGTIYIGESRDHKLDAISPEGILKWYFQTDGRIFSSPAIGADGTIYFCSYDGYFYALNPDSTLRWSYYIGGYASGSSPAIAPDGTIYVFSEAFSVREHVKLYALNPDGTLKWSYETLKGVLTCPAVGADGTIYFGSYDGKLYALNPDGTLKWSYDTEGRVYSSPAIASDGTIFFGSTDKRFYALNADGSLKWSRLTEDVIYSSPAIGADGVIYFGSYDGYLYTLNPDSTLRWRYQTGDRVHSSPAIGADGTIYVGSHDNNLYAIGETPPTPTPPPPPVTPTPTTTPSIPPPSDNETYIYLGGSVFVIGLLFFGYRGVSSQMKRRRLEKEQIEREKAEIVAMIEKALEKDKA